MLHRSFGIIASGAMLLLFAAGCGGSGGGTSTAATPAPTPTPAPPVIKMATATVAGAPKAILTDPSGMTLYYETTDAGGKVNCSGACAAVWPPLLLPADVTKPTAGSGVTGSVGTVADPDGKMQITYNGWPMYTFAKDKAAGDTTGDGVAKKWFVATPALAASA